MEELDKQYLFLISFGVIRMSIVESKRFTCIIKITPRCQNFLRNRSLKMYVPSNNINETMSAMFTYCLRTHQTSKR